jgi:tol-pal system protein YbgF
LLAAEPARPLPRDRSILSRNDRSQRRPRPAATPPAGGKNGLWACVALAGSLACTSSTELEQLRLQLGDVQRQLQRIETEAPDRSSLEVRDGAIRDDLALLLRATADLGEDLRRLDGRIDALEASLVNARSNFAELSSQIARAQEELENLGQLLARQPTTFGGEGAPPPGAPPSAADPEAFYQSAYNDYLRGNYELAIGGFRQFLASFAGSPLADNAQYWIGECLFHQQRFREAVAEFDRVRTAYPTSERLASALLRKGYALLEVGDTAAAREALIAVVDRFPRSDEAILAQRQLDSLGASP